MLKWLFLVLIIGFPLDSYTCHDGYQHDSGRQCVGGIRPSAVAPLPENRINFLKRRIEETEGQIQQIQRGLPQNICVDHINGLQKIRANMNEHTDPDRASNNIEELLNNCRQQIIQLIASEMSPSGRNGWYSVYLTNKKYEQDFERYPELKKQFNDRISETLQHISAFNRNIDDQGTVWDDIENWADNHPHFKDPTLPTEFREKLNTLEKDWKERECDPDNQKIKACHEKLKKTLTADNKKGLQAMCGKALQEGQVCCSSRLTKAVGILLLPKTSLRAFAKNLPGLGQSFAQIAAMKGDTEEACKLSHLSGLMGGLSGLHLDSCNKAIDGCRETCDAQLSKFKDAFKSCYKVSKKETIEAVLEKALTEEEETDDPRHPLL